MQKRFVTLMLTTGLLLASCAYGQNLSLLKSESFYKNGQLRERYSYYLDVKGNRVLQGIRELWEENGLLGTEEVYEAGRLIEQRLVGRNPQTDNPKNLKKGDTSPSLTNPDLADPKGS